MYICSFFFFFFSSRRRHTRYWRDWSSDVCSSDLYHSYPQLLPRGVAPFLRCETGLGERGVESASFFAVAYATTSETPWAKSHVNRFPKVSCPFHRQQRAAHRLDDVV